MGIVYDENPVRNSSGPLKDPNPAFLWGKHYGNFCYLDFLARNSDRWQERQQAQLEIAIAERKMEYWRRHKLFVASEAEAIKKGHDRKWNRG